MNRTHLKLFFITFCCLLAFSSCRKRDAYNPYLHAKKKPSQTIKDDYAKKDRWFRRKKNIKRIYFDKKN